jgi:acetyltransferase-like isoleucine patch superfamily enzyme
MTEYVMIGTSARLGDYIDIVHALKGQISKIVVNFPDEPDPAGRSFATRLDAYNRWRARWGIKENVVVQELKDFAPSENARYILGFSGLGQIPMQRYLADRWGIELETLVHPDATVSTMSELGSGCVVNPGCVIASEVRIGRLNWLGRGATIGHDISIDECAFIAPGVNLASAVHVGRGANIGIGANVLEHVSLGEQCYVAGGAFVRGDVAPSTLVAGVPAVVKKTLEPKVFPELPVGAS